MRWILALLALMMLSACTHQHCVSWGTRYEERQVCGRYSDTGHCAYWTYESYDVPVCDEYQCDSGYVMNGSGDCVAEAEYYGARY